MRMRIAIIISLTALALAACATAATEVPALPTILPTLPPADTAVPTQAQPDQNPTTPPDQSAATQAQPVQDATGQALLATIPPDQSQPATPVLPGEGTPLPTSIIQEVIGMLPPPGTAVAPATEEVDPVRAAMPFSDILYEETGGPSNASLSVEILGDGTVIRNGVQSTISADVVDQINQTIRDINFFGIEGQFTKFGAGPDIYKYDVRVELANGSSRSLQAHQGVTPPELLRLFTLLRNIGA